MDAPSAVVIGLPLHLAVRSLPLALAQRLVEAVRGCRLLQH